MIQGHHICGGDKYSQQTWFMNYMVLKFEVSHEEQLKVTHEKKMHHDMNERSEM